MNRQFGLWPLSVLYLALPNVLFLALWLRPEFSVVLSGLVIAGVVFLLRRSATAAPIERSELLWAIGIAASFAVLSGAGGIGLQNWDYDKHNAVLHDGVVRSLPIRYADVGDPALAGPLVYYLGWYMPGIVAGRLGGWEVANAVQFGWTLIGLTLAFLWFAQVAGARVRYAAPFLALFSGMDIVGALGTGRLPWAMSNLDLHHWAGFAQYSHGLGLIDWVPHHALPMWIGAGMALSAAPSDRNRAELPGVFSLLPFWSPWAAIGCAPLVALAWFRGRETRFGLGSALIAITLLPVMALFLGSSRGNVVRNWPWEGTGFGPFIGAYLAFIVVEFALIGVLVWRIQNPRGSDRRFLAVALVGLYLLPLYRFGISSDLTMRASVPLLFVLAVFALRAIQTRERSVHRSALMILLGIGALSPLHELVWSLAHYRFGPPDPATIYPVPFTDGRNYAQQFIGDPRKPFWRYLAR